MITQPLVVRVSYKNQADMLKAFNAFEGIGVFGDHMPPDKECPNWRVLFVDKEQNLAKVMIRRTGVHPLKVEVYEPMDGAAGFKPLHM